MDAISGAHTRHVNEMGTSQHRILKKAAVLHNGQPLLPATNLLNDRAAIDQACERDPEADKKRHLRSGMEIFDAAHDPFANSELAGLNFDKRFPVGIGYIAAGFQK